MNPRSLRALWDPCDAKIAHSQQSFPHADNPRTRYLLLARHFPIIRVYALNTDKSHNLQLITMSSVKTLIQTWNKQDPPSKQFFFMMQKTHRFVWHLLTTWTKRFLGYERRIRTKIHGREKLCRSVTLDKYLGRFLDNYTEGALILRRGILDDSHRRRFWVRLEIVLRPIVHASSPIAGQFVDRQSFEERPSLLDLALARFTFAPFTTRYLGIRGGAADAAGGGGPLPVRDSNEKTMLMNGI